MRHLWRIIKFSFVDIARNASLSFMTILILTLLLLSVNTLFGVRFLTSQAVSAIKQKIDVSIYVKPTVSDEDTEKLKKTIEAFSDVKQVVYINRDDSLKNFKEKYKDNPEILASLNELDGNPLGATLIIKTDEPKDYEKIIAGINKPEFNSLIEDKTFADTQTAITKIQTITTQIEHFAIGITSLFAFIAIIIVFNTIRVAIYTERVEIGIKKLVGASNWFIRGPYLFEAFFFSTLALIIASGVVYAGIRLLDPIVSPLFDQPAMLTTGLKTHILALVGIQYGAILGLTILTSAVAMRKYLKT